MPLLRPLHSLEAWVQHFRDYDFPVLAHSAEQLELLRANEDDVDAHLIGETFANDPLMTLKVLRHAASLGRERRSGEIETTTTAVVLMGITPFFAAFGPQTSIETVLAGGPDALDGADAVFSRSERAARFALGFAAHRMDPDAQLIHGAALLHDFAELLMWCEAPSLMLQIRLRQRMDASLRSSRVQKEVLGVELADLQQALMKAWHLPQTLAHFSNDKTRTPDASELCVLYATRLARHTAEGWDNAALPDDVRDVGALLNLGHEPTLRLLHDILGEPLPPVNTTY
ncbi:MAG: HDOD domain-containing protein [Burkholderiales bacterium]|nr:HDOD domain-containing protein [Burkholderiales bacterium]